MITAFESETNSILDTKVVIIDILDVAFMDITAIFTLKDLIYKLEKDDIKIIIVSKTKDKIQLLKLNKRRIFDNVKFYDSMEKAIK